MGRRQSSGGPLLFKLALGILVIMVGWLTWHNLSRLFSSGDEGGPRAMVEQFYKYEQAGDFGSAWELFDPLMQQRFSKPVYIQNRAHIIMQDFGVKTFEFHAGKPKLLTGWKMSSDADEIAEVYQIDVTQFFHTPYGNFKIVQSCYASDASGEWRLLWSYEDDAEAQNGQ